MKQKIITELYQQVVKWIKSLRREKRIVSTSPYPFNDLVNALQVWALSAIRNDLLDIEPDEKAIQALHTLIYYGKKSGIKKFQQKVATTVLNETLREAYQLKDITELQISAGSSLITAAQRRFFWFEQPPWHPLPLAFWVELGDIAWNDAVFKADLGRILKAFLQPRAFFINKFSIHDHRPSPQILWIALGFVSETLYWQVPEGIKKLPDDYKPSFWEYWLLIELFKFGVCQRGNPNKAVYWLLIELFKFGVCQRGNPNKAVSDDLQDMVTERLKKLTTETTLLCKNPLLLQPLFQKERELLGKHTKEEAMQMEAERIHIPSHMAHYFSNSCP